MPNQQLPPYLADPSTPRARYLLKADSDQMHRWRATADAQGVTFAAHVRDALDSYSPPVAPATGVGSRWVPPGMVVVSRECHTADHRACQTAGCECTCH